MTLQGIQEVPRSLFQGPDVILEDRVVECWLASTRNAYVHARAQRLGVLTGEELPEWGHGTHLWSVLVGEVRAFERLCPWLRKVSDGPTSGLLELAGREDAQVEFIELLRSEE